MDVYLDSKPEGARGAVIDTGIRDRKAALPGVVYAIECIATELRAAPSADRVRALAAKLRSIAAQIDPAPPVCESADLSDGDDPAESEIEPDPVAVAEAVAVLAAVEASAPPASRKRKPGHAASSDS
jgi:hypothetical protein